MTRSKYIAGILAIVMVSCASEAPLTDHEWDYHATLDIADSLGLKENEARILLLPAPLQVPNNLKLTGADYHPSLLVELSKDAASRTQYEAAIAVGLYATDLGYSIMFEDYSTGMQYAKTIESILQFMNIRIAEKNVLAKRFEQHRNSMDSLSVLVLESYQKAGQYLQENQQEGLGLLMMVGCYVEGMYLAFESINTEKGYEAFASMWPQQNLYLDNVLMLLGYYSAAGEADILIEGMSDIKVALAQWMKLDHKRLNKVEQEKQAEKVRTVIWNFRQSIIS
ncbi:MAG: hypothetical protein KDD36_14155 [Flavobacteriales bacterium]|nr:hypothetical protein [Flavobacteriales bacterium]